MEKLNKRDLIEMVADKVKVSKKDAEGAVDVVFGAIEKALVSGREVNITNFGVFEAKMREARVGTDPKSHKRITIKAKRAVAFRVSKTLKAKLNK